jgi:hypothetical protein
VQYIKIDWAQEKIQVLAAKTESELDIEVITQVDADEATLLRLEVVKGIGLGSEVQIRKAVVTSAEAEDEGEEDEVTIADWELLR